MTGNRADATDQARLMRMATYASVSVAAFLIAIKLAAWLMTGSVSVLSSLVDSVLDSIASLINLIAIRHALTPADREHRFGHGKAESIAGLGQSAFIAGSAAFLIFESARRFASPQEISHGAVGIGVMVVSIVATFLLVRYQMYVVRKTDSTAIGADSLHYKGDLLVNVAIIFSLIMSAGLSLTWVDPTIAILIALYILYNAWMVAREAFNALMDHEFPDEDRKRILDIAMAHPQVKGAHDLRTRRSGVQPFIQLHLELDGEMTLHDAHIISDQVEAEIIQAFPGAEVIIHQDPEGIAEPMPSFARR